jgi:GGDEF domain-containing protein
MTTTGQTTATRRHTTTPRAAESRRFQAVRPVDVELELAQRSQRYHAMMSPLLATAGALGAWLLAAHDGGASSAAGYWGLTTALLFAGYVAAAIGARMPAGRPDALWWLATTLVLLAAACLGTGAALLLSAEDLWLACVVGATLCGLAMVCMAGRPLRFAAFAALLLGPLAIAAMAAPAADRLLALAMGGSFAAMVTAHALLSSAMTAALRSEARHRATLGRLEVANEVLFADREVLHTESRTDALTGAANRRHLEEMLQSEWNRCRRSGSPLSCLLLDIDHFKDFNDHYGHDGGDGCLRQVAALLMGKIRRAGDVVARYGGEEFVVLLPETGGEGATTVAEVTISLGVATLVPDSERLASELLKAADLALYEAKRSGRNCVVMADAETLESARMAARGLLG